MLRLPLLRQFAVLAQQVADPRRTAVVVAVAVGVVVHDLAVAQLAGLVNLPEDHSAVAAGT